MLEYKREKSNLEVRVQDLEKKSVDHDDHIRIIDAWWLQVCRVIPASRTALTRLQLLQEIELLVDGTVSSSFDSPGELAFSPNNRMQDPYTFKTVRSLPVYISRTARTSRGT
jgi:E3 ubiquitin-protein ligase BRE1